MKGFKTQVYVRDLNSALGYPQFEYKIHQVVDLMEGYDRNNISSLVNGKVYKAIPGDKIFLHTGCDIPRFKVKEFCLDKKVALVKDYNRATARFIGPDFINELVNEIGPHIRVTKSSFMEWLTKNTLMGDIKYMKLKQDIQASTSDIVIMSGHLLAEAMTTIWGSCPTVLTRMDKKGVEVSHFHGGIWVVKSEETAQVLTNLLAAPNIYDQNDIVRVLNKAIVMDEPTYQTMRRLFKAEDREHHTLAMETMANCDFQNSCVYLLLLIREFGADQIYASKTRHHVNFKALLKFFNIQSLHHYTLDSIIDSLRARKLLSPTNLEKLIPLAQQAIQSTSNLKHFSVNSVSVSKAVGDALAENVIEFFKEPTESLNLNPES